MDPFVAGVPFGRRSPRKPGPYSMPINIFEWIVGNRNSASSQIGMPLALAGPGATTNTFQAHAVNTAAAWTLNLTGTLSAGAVSDSETMTIQAYQAFYLYRP